VDSPALKYALHVSTTYAGDAGDVINGGANHFDHNGMKFSANTMMMTVMNVIAVRRRRWSIMIVMMIRTIMSLSVMMFSAKDQDHDLANGFHCAQYYVGGWWHNACFFFCPTCADPRYSGFLNFGLAGSSAIQKTRMMANIAD